MQSRVNVLAVLLAFFWAVVPGHASADNVVTYHNSLERHGAYTVKGLTLATAANMQLDTGFNSAISGDVYAQPLFWHPPGGEAVVIVATESNTVFAIDATTGATVWQATLGSPVPLNQLPCGNIDPDGITGTPVIDPTAGVIYLDALSNVNSKARHLVYALSLADGSTLSGWPLDVEAALSNAGVTFSSPNQGERSALQLYDGALYVNYGGNFGDCQPYHGTVIQLQTSPPTLVANWQTSAAGGGIWAQGGAAGDGKSVFVTTGNTSGASKWGGGEAIVRLYPGLAAPKSKKDYFAPSDWKTLDDDDLDLGGTEALPFEIGKAQRVIAFGKDGNAYLADRNNLGGIGGQLAKLHVSNGEIITAPVIYQTSTSAMVAFRNGGGGKCSGSDITMLDVAADGKKPITVAWCAAFSGAGAPIITTSDGTSDPIVWVTGAEGDGLLHGFNALTGQIVFSGNNQVMSNLRHFGTIMAAEGRFYIAADNKVYAFTFKSKK
jgi:outer membrane protein assembly factor BamB